MRPHLVVGLLSFAASPWCLQALHLPHRLPAAACINVRPSMRPLGKAATTSFHAAAARHHARSRVPFMQSELPFWENVSRFARFFVTSVSGLIFGLLSPFAAFARTPALAAVGASLFVGTLAFVYITLTAMQTPIETYQPLAPTERSAPSSTAAGGQTGGTQLDVRDGSMKKMLEDIYGP